MRSIKYQKSIASISLYLFPQITRQILTTKKIHWLELITITLNFLNLFSLRKKQ